MENDVKQQLLNEIKKCDIQISAVLTFKKKQYVRTIDWKLIPFDKELLEKQMKEQIINTLTNKM